MADTPEELLRNADAAMYKAKDEGRNSYQFYTQDMTERAFERVLMETNLRRALENEEFVVYYQPQYDVEKAGICRDGSSGALGAPGNGDGIPRAVYSDSGRNGTDCAR